MSDYSQTFDNDVDEGGVRDFARISEKKRNASAGAGAGAGNSSEHRLRLSIDIHSLKEHDFRGNIYARYQSVIGMNVKQFKSAPPIAITKPRVEEQFPNSYRNYTFDAASEELAERIQGELEIELWHQDRLKKDILIGIAKFNLANLLKGKVQKTGQSFAKVSDQYLPVDEVDEDRRAVRKIAEVRVVLILEDLGPVEQLARRERQLGIKAPGGENGVRDLLQNDDADDLDQQNQPALMLPEKNEIFGDLEYKIIWELETWKKAEESKFKIILKQKEMDFLTQLSEEWKKREFEKEKVFKKTETSINLLGKKMKEKATELQKREQKIVLLEEELKTRINETSRQIQNKEDEINLLKRKLKDEKGNTEKEKIALILQNDQLKEESVQLRKEYEKYKKEQQNSPIALVKNELKDKELEIKELRKELGKSAEICDQYKMYYEKFRGELLKQKKMYEMLKDETNFKNNAEIESLRNEISQLKTHALNPVTIVGSSDNQNMNSNNNNTNNNNNLHHVTNPFKRNLFDMPQQDQQNYGREGGMVASQFEEYNWNNDAMGELENLIYQRDYMISQVGYSESDPIVIDLNSKIKALQQ